MTPPRRALCSLTSLALSLSLLPLAAFAAPLTAEFQQNGTYEGTVMMRLRNQDNVAAHAGTASMDVDGGDSQLGDALYSLIFLRFDDIFGDGTGQIPYGSEIVHAELELTTNVSGNAQSGNIFTTAALTNPLLVPETGTIYASYTNSSGFGGPDFGDGHTSRPGNPFRSVNTPILTQDQGEKTFNDITEFVRGWSKGTVETPLNHGLIISDTNGTDGWTLASIGHATEASRPLLRVVYYPPALAQEFQSKTVVFEQGTYNPDTGNFYENCVSAFLPDTVTPVNNANFATLSARVPEDGSTITGPRYLDGANPPTSDSADDQMLIQFNDIFGDQPGQIRLQPNLRIERASLRLTTGPTGDNRSPGPVEVHRMLTSWYTADEFNVRTFRPYTDFVAPDAPEGTIGLGPTVASGDAAPAEFSYWGMQLNQALDADVTESVKAWAAGAPNYGWSVQHSTSDGWAIYFPGASAAGTRPQLVITYSYEPDEDLDGLPDAWETANGTSKSVADAGADADSDGLTNMQEYLLGTKANSADSDSDGFSDKVETGTGTWVDATNTGTSPVRADSDGDGLHDGLENPDLPWTGATQPGTDPNKKDSDGDGVPDYTEVKLESNPASAESLPSGGYTAIIAENFDSSPVNSVPGFISSSGAFGAGPYDTLVPNYGQAAQLTDGVAASVNTAVAWDYVPVQGHSVKFTFDYRMSADVGTAEAADGMGFGLFRTSNAAVGETGAANPGAAPRAWEDPRAAGGFPDAVLFGFDIYGGATEGNTLRITGPQDPTAILASVVPSFPLNNGTFTRVEITANSAGAAGTLFHVDITPDVAGSSAPVTTRLVRDLSVPGFDITSEQFRLVFGGRNGTSKVKTEIDNIRVAVAGTVTQPPVDADFTITGAVPSTEGLTLTWTATSGTAYVVEASETMATGSWTTVGDPVTATGSTATVLVPAASADPETRFFRIRRTAAQQP